MTTLEHCSYGRELERQEVEEERKQYPLSNMGLGDLIRAERQLVFERPYVAGHAPKEQRPWVGRYLEIINELNNRFPAPHTTDLP